MAFWTGKPAAIRRTRPAILTMEELVQVGGEDGEEADALEQRDLVVLGQFEDPLVELDPAVLPVEVPVGGEIVTHDPHCPRACSRRKRVRRGMRAPYDL